MTDFGGARPLIQAQAGFRRDALLLFRDAARESGRMVGRFVGVDGRIPARSERTVLAAVGQIVSDLYTAGDNRSAFGQDGVTALAPYPRLLNRWIVYATAAAVRQHTAWLRANTPPDVFAYLKGGRRVVSEQVNPDMPRDWARPHEWTDDRGYRLSDRIWRTDLESRRKIDELLRAGIRGERSVVDISAALEAYLVPGRSGIRTLKPYGARHQPGGASFDAMRLGRTEVARAFNEAALASAQMNPFVDRVDVARSANGDPTCPICPQHATIGIGGERLRPPYPVGSARVGPYHPHCVLGDTLIESPGRIAAASQSFYCGEVVEIRTSSGHRLACTLNHPILTTDGWIAAQFLNEGQQVFVAAGGQREASSIEPYHNDMPTRIEQIFASLLETRGVVSRHVPSSAEDFHNDGRFMNGDVHIIDVDGLLLGHNETRLSQSRRQFSFGRHNSCLFPLFGFGVSNLLLDAFRFATNGSMSIGSDLLPKFGSCFAQPGVLSLGGSAFLDTILPQHAINNTPGDAFVFGDTLNGFPSDVTPEKIVEIRKFDFTGHVYDLQIEPQHWYIANGIIAHNCLCHVRPVVVEDRAAVIAQLRALMDSGAAYSLNPADEWAWLEWLLGAALVEQAWDLIAA